MKSTINIIADDAAARDSWAQLLAVHGYETREYPDSMSYLERYGSPSDGCVLLDIRMPGMNGMDLQKELHRLGRNDPVVFVTSYGDVGLAVKAMKAGAVNLLQKPCAEDELIEAVQDALARKEDFQESKAAREKARVAIARLTDREREVLGYVSKGMTSKAIARQLGIAVRTVDIHRANMMLKTDTRNVVELVRMAFAAGFVCG